jgi:SAM-dependent methyltransferase
VLDVGSGTGFPALELAARSGDAGRVVGIDIWRAALVRARHKRDVHHARTVSFVAADAVALPFRDAEFDLIVSNLGINNFDDPAAVVRECARVLKPGAPLALTTNLEGHMRELYDLFRVVVSELCDASALERLRANEAHRGTVASVRALLAGAGLAVTRLSHDRLVLRYADGGALLRDPLVRLGFLPGWRAVPGAEAERRVFATLERRLDDLAASRGELAMEVPMLFVEARR